MESTNMSEMSAIDQFEALPVEDGSRSCRAVRSLLERLAEDQAVELRKYLKGSLMRSEFAE